VFHKSRRSQGAGWPCSKKEAPLIGTFIFASDCLSAATGIWPRARTFVARRHHSEAGEDYIATSVHLPGSTFLPESDRTVLLLLSCGAAANGGFGVTYASGVANHLVHCVIIVCGVN
jgi:hypothetical protein